MLDATGGTNSQKRPVVMMAFMDGDIKNICLITIISVDKTSNSFMNILVMCSSTGGRLTPSVSDCTKKNVRVSP